MLNKKLVYTLIVTLFVSAVGTAVLNILTDIHMMALLMLHSLVSFTILVWFLIDIYRNPHVRNRWVWMVLTFIASGVVMIVYTVTYVPEKHAA